MFTKDFSAGNYMTPGIVSSVRLWGVLSSPPGLSTSNRLSEGIPLKFNHMSYVFFQRFLS